MRWKKRPSTNLSCSAKWELAGREDVLAAIVDYPRPEHLFVGVLKPGDNLHVESGRVGLVGMAIDDYASRL